MYIIYLAKLRHDFGDFLDSRREKFTIHSSQFTLRSLTLTLNPKVGKRVSSILTIIIIYIIILIIYY